MFFIFKDRIPPKKNSKQIVKWHLFSSYRYDYWNKYVVSNIKSFVYFQNNEKKDLYKYKNEENLKIKVTFFLKDKRKFDLTNVLQSIEDTLSDAWIIKDDNYKVLSWFEYFIDKNTKSDIFAIVELSKLTEKEIEKKKKAFSKFYNILNNKDLIEKIENIKIPIKKSNKKKKKKEKIYFDI